MPPSPAGTWAPSAFTDYARTLRAGVENMRKLVYAFYHPKFSFSRPDQ